MVDCRTDTRSSDPLLVIQIGGSDECIAEPLKRSASGAANKKTPGLFRHGEVVHEMAVCSLKDRTKQA